MDYEGPSYAEARWWFVWLDLFTESDLADAMAVNTFVAKRFIKAGVWHGIIQDTGDKVDGTGALENIFSYVPLPPGPREHPSETPEWKATEGCYSLARATGMPVRIRSDRDARRAGSLPGQGHQMRLREQRYQEMVKKVEARMLANKAKAQKEPKWKRRK